VTVPKAPVDEDNRPPAGEDKIWTPRESAIMEAKPITQSVKKAADSQLRARIPALDRGHNAATLEWEQMIQWYLAVSRSDLDTLFLLQ
jgi:hypothetical protein